MAYNRFTQDHMNLPKPKEPYMLQSDILRITNDVKVLRAIDTYTVEPNSSNRVDMVRTIVEASRKPDSTATDAKQQAAMPDSAAMYAKQRMWWLRRLHDAADTLSVQCQLSDEPYKALGSMANALAELAQLEMSKD